MSIRTHANASLQTLHLASLAHSQINMAMGAGTLATGAVFVSQPSEGLATAALMTNAGLTGESVCKCEADRLATDTPCPKSNSDPNTTPNP